MALVLVTRGLLVTWGATAFPGTASAAAESSLNRVISCSSVEHAGAVTIPARVHVDGRPFEGLPGAVW
jgi:hypothetical protein